MYRSTIGPHWRFISSGARAYPYPGKSTKQNDPLISKKLISWVRPGVELVRANPRTPSKLLIKLDLPTFDLPRKATSGRLVKGNCSGSTALLTNLVLTI